jgi:DNA-binding NarL/FixJ family response regulator
VIRLVIADDHAVVRRGVRQIVDSERDMTVVAEGSSASELIELTRKHRPDMIVVDVTMPGRSGLDALKQLRQELPRMPVLVLSMHPEDQYAVRALKAGASGYLTKESAPEELVKAVRRVMAGGRYVSASLAERLATDLVGNVDGPLHERLSDRECQILCLLASGKPRREIADELSLSVKTVSSYRERILEKTGMKTNAELTRYAIAHQLVS